MTGTIGRDLQQICARERAVIELGPLVAPGRLGRLAPFGAVLALAMPLVLFDPDSDLALRAVLVVGTALTLLVGCLVPWVGSHVERKASSFSCPWAWSLPCSS